MCLLRGDRIDAPRTIKPSADCKEMTKEIGTRSPFITVFTVNCATGHRRTRNIKGKLEVAEFELDHKSVKLENVMKNKHDLSSSANQTPYA